MKHSIERFPFLLTILTIVLIYGLIGLYEGVRTRTVEWIVSALFWIWTIVAYSACIHFVFRIFDEKADPLTASQQFWSFVDCFLSITHTLAALGFTIYLLDTSATKDQFFTDFDTTAGPLRIFVADFLASTTAAFTTLGFFRMTPTDSAIAPGLWIILISLTSISMLVFMGAIILRSVKKRSIISTEEDEENPSLTSHLVTDYAAVFRHGQRQQRFSKAPQLKRYARTPQGWHKKK